MTSISTDLLGKTFHFSHASSLIYSSSHFSKIAQRNIFLIKTSFLLSIVFLQFLRSSHIFGCVCLCVFKNVSVQEGIHITQRRFQLIEFNWVSDLVLRSLSFRTSSLATVFFRSLFECMSRFLPDSHTIVYSVNVFAACIYDSNQTCGRAFAY